jgi:hypothetical protein
MSQHAPAGQGMATGHAPERIAPHSPMNSEPQRRATQLTE